jgi:DNA-binding XRE family transcriptional regulator
MWSGMGRFGSRECGTEAGATMITSHQMRAARALLGVDQRELAKMAQVSLPTIQRMEASDGQVRGVVESLVKVVNAFEGAGIELIGDRAPSAGTGRGVRLRESGAGTAAIKTEALHAPKRADDQVA